MIKKLGFIFTAREKRNFFFLMIIIVIGSFLELLGVTAFMPFIDILMDENAIADTWWLSWLYTLFDFDSTETFLASLAGCIIAIYIIYFSF